MTKNVYFAIDYYDRQVIQLIIDKYKIPPMEAMKSFILSKTHAMLEDSECGMLSLPEYAVFDMCRKHYDLHKDLDREHCREVRLEKLRHLRLMGLLL